MLIRIQENFINLIQELVYEITLQTELNIKLINHRHLPRGEDKLHPDVLLSREYQKINIFDFREAGCFHYYARLIFSILNRIGNIKDILTIVKPETVLLWQKLMIKRFWTYKSKNRTGRPPIKKEIKLIILNMKNDNLYWSYKKIQGNY